MRHDTQMTVRVLSLKRIPDFDYASYMIPTKKQIDIIIVRALDSNSLVVDYNRQFGIIVSFNEPLFSYRINHIAFLFYLNELI